MHFPMMLWKFHDDLMHACGSQQKWAGGRGGRPDMGNCMLAVDESG